MFAVAALIVTYSYLENSKRYGLRNLALVLWATTAMIFIDHTLGWLMEGGDYFDIGIEPFILSIAMIIPIFAVWEAFFLKNKITRYGLVQEDK
ncbi:MAG: hypothetical protein FWC29_03400 [Methanomassiliicoccaceae archaeon]|nr:hypothetical protein [Methanomassiliicoccaceae archaeon]